MAWTRLLGKQHQTCTRLVSSRGGGGSTIQESALFVHWLLETGHYSRQDTIQKMALMARERQVVILKFVNKESIIIISVVHKALPYMGIERSSERETHHLIMWK